MNTEMRTKFLDWLELQVVRDARGDEAKTLDVKPSSRLWLGRLASETRVASNPMGDRGERLDPCAVGIRALVDAIPSTATITASVTPWLKIDGVWTKASKALIVVPLILSESTPAQQSLGIDDFSLALRDVGADGLAARIDVTWRKEETGADELTVQLVNSSPEDVAGLEDVNLYECSFTVHGLKMRPYKLAALPDSFRYENEILAFGLNCGVECTSDGGIATCDTVGVDRSRPNYWGAEGTAPDLRFERLATDPAAAADELIRHLRDWGDANWSHSRLLERRDAEGWTAEMFNEAMEEAKHFEEELARIRTGGSLLASEPALATCFRAMNTAMNTASRGRYDSWRPFQFGFLLANLNSLVDSGGEREIADVVWFSTGGGKTETYLGLLITSILFDRMRGKLTGISAWSRFPLRMLSLQQTQRFADALAAAEIVRAGMELPGDRFSLGFFVGGTSTPNRVSEEMADDPGLASRYRMLDRCPFCANTDLTMRFDRARWVLLHLCKSPNCSSGGELPIHVVDDEIYRVLPTVVVGTLDKAASISMQASMRGFVGAPLGLCTRPGHGYTYAVRSSKPHGCLVPGCQAPSGELPQPAALYAPSFRLQDELHLLRDSLGAIDAHYEALYDDLQTALGAPKAKILASSATLAGYEEQIDVLYRRKARVFPCPPPLVGHGFWSRETDELMRRYVALAPRGVTVDFAVDRMLTVMQNSVRALLERPEATCRTIGVPEIAIPDLVSLYGTDVVYGNTLRDLEAVARSSETQLLVEGPLNHESLTGKTNFEEVRRTLSRLQAPEMAFEDRIHLVTASAMMSHGVDIDRLNVMIMLGLPLATAEFIQATARVGRTHPGLVFVMHKIGRERDASIFRSFGQFIRQGDRFVEPIPITRRSRRVLERTVPGLAMGRILMLHEPLSGIALTTPQKLRQLLDNGSYTMAGEVAAIARALALNGWLDESMERDVQIWFDRWEENLRNPLPDGRFLNDNMPGGRRPMLSLRDVDTQVNVFGRRT